MKGVPRNPRASLRSQQRTPSQRRNEDLRAAAATTTVTNTRTAMNTGITAGLKPKSRSLIIHLLIKRRATGLPLNATRRLRELASVLDLRTTSTTNQVCLNSWKQSDRSCFVEMPPYSDETRRFKTSRSGLRKSRRKSKHWRQSYDNKKPPMVRSAFNK